MKHIGVIDSLCISAPVMSYYLNDEGYSIEDIKSIGAFKPKVWIETFGKPLAQHIIYAGIIHTHLGVRLPLKQYANSKTETLDIAGIHRYDERSKHIQVHLQELIPLMQDCIVKQVDVAIDMDSMPRRTFNLLIKKRKKYLHKNSIYFKTKSEKKTNRYINVIFYDKQLKDANSPHKYRLEFSFRGNAVGMELADLDLKKLERSIKKLSGLDVNIAPIS